MNTIEERARKAASRCIEWFFDKNKEDVDGVTHTIQYALTEQKAIDIEKACQEFCRNCRLHNDMIGNDCKCNQLEAFHKAMEE